MTEERWDVIVIGAGAAGLMAAIHAAERGKRTLVLEKNRKAGVKILMSGGTRCNITHATDNRGIVAAYGPPGKFLHSALAAFSVQDTLDFFHAEGVATKVEETGKIFPVSNRAIDVLEALLGRLARSGAELRLATPVLDVAVVPPDGGHAARHPRDGRAVVSRRGHDRRRLSLRPGPRTRHRSPQARAGSTHHGPPLGRRPARHHAAGRGSESPRRG